MPEQIFTEAIARVSDTRGRIWVTGSLGVQYRNPKAHWLYKHFKEKPLDGSEIFEWSTADNPYFPAEEIDRLRDTLDPITFKQMFEICWDVQGTNLVYDSFSQDNIMPTIAYNPALETSVSIDWGFAHEMACLYFQHDPRTDTIYQIDEIVASKMTLEQLWTKMQAKPYRINNYYCDIAGSQEREQTGISNIQWFKQSPRNIYFKYRTSAVVHGISVVRSFIKNAKGQIRFFISEQTCPKTIDDMRNFSYDVKNGIASSEIPKSKPDSSDAMRYYFVNRHDYTRTKDSFEELSRWQLQGR